MSLFWIDFIAVMTACSVTIGAIEYHDYRKGNEADAS